MKRLMDIISIVIFLFAFNLQGKAQEVIYPNPGFAISPIDGDTTGWKNNVAVIEYDSENVLAENYFEVYPNPSDGDFFLQPATTLKGEMLMVVYDLSGQVVETKMLVDPSADGRIEIQYRNSLKPGIYFLKFYWRHIPFESNKIIVSDYGDDKEK